MSAGEREQKLVDLLTRAIPSLSVSVDLAKSTASRANRRALLHEAETAIGPAKVNELVSGNHDRVFLAEDPDVALNELRDDCARQMANAIEDEREACADIARNIFVGNTEIPRKDAAAWIACAEFILDEIRRRP
jgi:hypothetical protein